MANIVFFILLTLSSTIHARESQFFNKFSNNIPQESQHLNTNQQPEFIPQTQDSNSYGLYGQESSQLPPSTTTTNTNNNYDNNNYYNNNINNNNNNNKNNLPSYLPANYNPVAYTTPIHSNTQDIPNEFNDPNAYKYNGENSEEFVGTNGGDVYNSEKQGFDDARFMETEDAGNTYNSEKQVENGRYNQGMGGTKYSTSNNANMYNSGKQGMSDTRFLENGKYYYDVNMENVNSNANMNTRGVNWKNEYNTQGYYGNNENENSYDRYNSNPNSNGGGYEDQEDQFNP